MKKTRRVKCSGRAKGRVKGAALGVYTQRERAIFRYCGGCAKGPLQCHDCRAKDPLEIQQTLLEFPEFDIENDGKVWDSELIPTKDKLKVLAHFVAAISQAFGVQLYDEHAGTGLTREEMMTLLQDYGRWIFELKKKRGVTPSLPKPMESAVSPASSPISNGADSGSTVAGCSVAEVSQSPTASPPPSEPSCPIASGAK